MSISRSGKLATTSNSRVSIAAIFAYFVIASVTVGSGNSSPDHEFPNPVRYGAEFEPAAGGTGPVRFPTAAAEDVDDGDGPGVPRSAAPAGHLDQYQHHPDPPSSIPRNCPTCCYENLPMTCRMQCPERCGDAYVRYLRDYYEHMIAGNRGAY